MKTTKKQFNYFCRRFRYWMKRLNISGYEVYFYHDDIGDNTASIERDYVARIAIVKFTNSWEDNLMPLTNEVLDRCACEEAIHVLFTPLRYFSTIGKRMKEEIIESEEHVVINSILEALLNGH